MRLKICWKIIKSVFSTSFFIYSFLPGYFYQSFLPGHFYQVIITRSLSNWKENWKWDKVDKIFQWKNWKTDKLWQNFQYLNFDYSSEIYQSYHFPCKLALFLSETILKYQYPKSVITVTWVWDPSQKEYIYKCAISQRQYWYVKNNPNRIFHSCNIKSKSSWEGPSHSYWRNPSLIDHHVFRGVSNNDIPYFQEPVL